MQNTPKTPNKNLDNIFGQWDAFDRVLMYINSIDVDGKTAKEIKKQIYHDVMEMRPE